MQFVATMMRPIISSETLAVVLLLCQCTASVHAQTVTYTNLYTLGTPVGSNYINVTDAAGGQVVGSNFDGAENFDYHAQLWTGTTGAAVDLNPSGFAFSAVYATDGIHQVGQGSPTGDDQHALLWNGSAGSVVDLNPSSFMDSNAFGTSGTEEVGEGSGTATGGIEHALLWSGTAASYVDLNPTGFSDSVAHANNNTQQVGYGYGAATDNITHALLWSGTAASTVDLNPTGFNTSYALGTSGMQQVGYGWSTGGYNNSHALLWNSTAASAIDLNPTGFTASYADDTSGTEQIGYGVNPITGDFDALLWSGTASSYVDLGSLLPSNIRYSEANSISGDNIYGYAEDTSGNYYAIQWTVSAVPEPAASSLIAALAGSALLTRRRRCEAVAVSTPAV